MKRMYVQLFLLAGLVFAECSGKDSDPQPVNPIALNTAAVMVDGVAFPVDISRTGAAVDTRNGELRVNIGSSDAQGPLITLRIVEFRKKAENIQFYPASPSGIYMGGRIVGNTDGDFFTESCNPLVRSFEIVAVDEKNKTVSVRFSGTICGGANNTKSRIISEGQFNLPYILQ